MNLINVIDQKTYNYIIQLMSRNMTAFMTAVSHLASAITLITLTIAFIIIFKDKKDAKFITLNLILSFIFNRILKIIVARPRPNVLRLSSESGYSFPSGHTMIATAFYGFLIYLIYKKISNKFIKYILITLISLLVICIGISRIYLGVHYTTDVIGGIIIGIIYLSFFIKYLYKKAVKSKKKF